MSDMKCPYCGELLDFVCDENGSPDITHYFCLNTSCGFFGESAPNKILQDLIDGKKDTVKRRAIMKVSGTGTYYVLIKIRGHQGWRDRVRVANHPRRNSRGIR